jgi:hypothetical protein
MQEELCIHSKIQKRQLGPYLEKEIEIVSIRLAALVIDIDHEGLVLGTLIVLPLQLDRSKMARPE